MTFKNKTTKATTTKKYRCTVLAEKTEEETPVVDETIQIASIKQNTFTEFTVTMSTALESVATSNFSMVRDNDNQVIAVKSATLDSSDSTKVTLIVYTSLTDAKTYTVTYTADDETATQSSAQITVTDGTVADVAVTPLEVTAGTETKILFQTLDANGVILSSDGYSAVGSYTEPSWSSSLGTFNETDSKLLLDSVGDTATFTMTYHTYQYDSSTGEELDVISKEFTVVAVEDASTIVSYNYTVATSAPSDWSTATITQKVALNDNDRLAYFLIKDSNGNDVTADCGYTVESSDNSIVVADGAVAGGVVLYPVATGSAYLMIKNSSGNVVYTLPITVVAARVLSSFTLSSTSVKISAAADFDTAPETCVFTDVTALDQYGENIAVSVGTPVLKSGNDVATFDTNSDDYLTVEGNDDKTAGTGYYTVTATDNEGNSKTTGLTVTTVSPDGTATYAIVFLNSDKKVVDSVDTTVSSTTSVGVGLTAVLVTKQSGVVVGAVDTETSSEVSAIKEVNLKKSSTKYNDCISTTSGSAVIINATSVSGSAITKNLGTGTYTVAYTMTMASGSTKTTSATFTVTDSQAAVTASVNKTAYTSGSTTIEDVLGNSDYVTYYYDGNETTVTIDEVTGYGKAGEKNKTVTYVKLTVNVEGYECGFVTTIYIGKTFTNSSGWSN